MTILESCGQTWNFEVRIETRSLWPFAVALLPATAAYGALLSLHLSPEWMVPGFLLTFAIWFASQWAIDWFMGRPLVMTVDSRGVTTREHGVERRLTFDEAKRLLVRARDRGQDGSLLLVDLRARLAKALPPDYEVATLAAAEAAARLAERTDEDAWVLINQGKRDGAPGPRFRVEVQGDRVRSVSLEGSRRISETVVDPASLPPGVIALFAVPTRLDGSYLSVVPEAIERLPDLDPLRHSASRG